MDGTGSGMKFVIAGVLLLAILASACSAGNKNQDPPKFFVRDTKISVGTKYEGEDINYTFKVRNNGVGELHILNVRPG